MSESSTTKEWLTIPILPCASVVEALDFWTMLGYTITYKQTRPYQYGVVERGGSALHFGYMKGLDKHSNSYTGCLVIVQDAAAVYKEFASRFKEYNGKVPNTGIPRISRMKPGATRFTLTDVSGNAVIFVSHGERDQEEWEEANKTDQSRMMKALAIAKRFRDYKNDDTMAAQTLDVALKHRDGESPLEVAEVLLMRIELAAAMNDEKGATECNTILQQLGLTDDELLLINKRNRTI
ncbi:VOC family protein [Chitinophaga filiformis]|uniref:Glyoxalase-like domain-containing protein n=1 Tax=Chitinophaga filiformis TaxID=104663 RepID=A0A1G7H1R1_CHIFI|nr:hypothetical protein [Chitinophaga filiformis]SDE94347.1 hypothetical protein SAMN04488121_101267 [Chitinophaga filiformis]